MNVIEWFGRPVPLVVSVLLAVCLSGCGPAAGAGSKPTTHAMARPDAEVLADGRRWVAAFYDGQTKELWEHFYEDMQKLLESKAGLDSFRAKAIAQLGKETKIVDEQVKRKGGGETYVRTAQFEKFGGPVVVMFAFASGGSIAGFSVAPRESAAREAPTTKLAYITRTRLRLPFGDAWTVAWGGRTLSDNQHAISRDQRFAYDFFVERSGTTHAAEGTHNDDYFAYGRPVVAPGPGTIVVAVDGVAENTPGAPNAKTPPGNHVVIDHGNGEFSFLAHLVPGSVAVKVGDRVEAGQTLGRCGNSGHSSEPHLHYHLQDSPRFGDGNGLPAQFESYLADGRAIDHGEPTRAQVVQASAVSR